MQLTEWGYGFQAAMQDRSIAKRINEDPAISSKYGQPATVQNNGSATCVFVSDEYYNDCVKAVADRRKPRLTAVELLRKIKKG